MRGPLIIIDLLCGAGGSSTGCINALLRLGYSINEIILACVNHWPIAIDTHTRNHPRARHYCQDIAAARPHIVVPEGRADLLMASPSCTHHSLARGGKPTSDQQRSDPWHIITWLTELDVDRLIIENVWEYTKWGPVEAVTRRPIKERECEYHDMWIDLIRKVDDYEPEWRKLNAADYGGATTRKRYIMMAKKRRRLITWPIITHGKGTTKPLRAAREIIDWSIKGRSIYGRPVPLSYKTLDRILEGMLKFGWPEPFVRRLLPEIERALLHAIRYNFRRRNTGKPEARAKRRKRVRAAIKRLLQLRAQQLGDHLSAKGRARPMVITLRNNADGRSPELPLPAITAGGTHIGLIEPFILNRHGDNGSARAHSTEMPAPTADCRGAGYLVEPFVLSQASGGAPRAVSEPLPTAVAGGAIAMISPYYGSGSGETCTTIEAPLPTATAKARFGLVVSITHSDNSNRARNADVDPLPTLTTAHRGELALVAGEDVADYDTLFRMLEPHELAAAMGFNTDEIKYEFAGNKTEQVKQIGNAVSVEMMEACVTAIFDDGEGAAAFLEAAE